MDSSKVTPVVREMEGKNLRSWWAVASRAGERQPIKGSLADFEQVG